MDWIRGKKTILVAIAIGVMTTLKTLGYVDEDTFNNGMRFLESAGLLAIRLAIGFGGNSDTGTTGCASRK